MAEARADTRFEQVVQKIDSRSKLLRAWELKGGVPAQVTALEIERPAGQMEKMIVRQPVTADEFKLLQRLHAVGLATPVPYFLDQSGEILSTPYVVLEYIEGQPEFSVAHVTEPMRQLAAQLSRIHQVDCTKLDVSLLPKQEQRYAEMMRARATDVDEVCDEGRIRKTLEAAWPLTQRNRSVLLHGDFWPGNILWKDGQLVAVIDWEDAALGDPLADVANGRLEMLWAYGVEAMQRFTQQYQALTMIDWTNLPYWELWADLRLAPRMGEWGLDTSSEQRMHERHRWFIAQAFEKLAVH
ncbi:MAG: phosphotransferase [Herpetosiphonaceae bacterium]|nr:phosphotransferase [Herpetosiphonaceae bacterium]